MFQFNCFNSIQTNKKRFNDYLLNGIQNLHLTKTKHFAKIIKNTISTISEIYKTLTVYVRFCSSESFETDSLTLSNNPKWLL